MSNRQRIISFLQNHPEGIDDDELAKALGLSARQQANMRCRELVKEGMVIRRPVSGKIHSFWAGNGLPATNPAVSDQAEAEPAKYGKWFWEGNVQARIVEYLVSQGYGICSTGDTVAHQQGIDVIAEGNGVQLWVSVKGYSTGTERTNPTVQAAHWFKQAVFDMIEYRERYKQVTLALALPDYSRYHRLAEKITWPKPMARFSHLWVKEDGKV